MTADGSGVPGEVVEKLGGKDRYPAEQQESLGNIVEEGGGDSAVLLWAQFLSSSFSGEPSGTR